VEAAAKQGWIELEPFPETRKDLLREAAFNKKKRVLEELEQESQTSGKAPYLKISQKEKDHFFSPPSVKGK